MMEKQYRIAVLGDGAWGTALALNLISGGHRAAVWGAFPENIEAMRRDRENRRFLPGVPLPDELELIPDMAEAVSGRDMLVLAAPSQYLRGTLQLLKDHLSSGQVLVNIAKGIEVGSLLRMSQLCEEVLGPRKNYAALSGPSHAEEVSRGIPTLVTVASRDPRTAGLVQKVFMNPRFRVYRSSDLIGVELGGALKNVFAVAAGILDGIGMGDNAKAALMTRGIAELARLGVKLGGRRATFSGLSGIGDLIVTCMSRHSRNRYVGEELGKGRKLDEIIRSMNMVVAEGVRTCEAAKALAESAGVETPLINGVYDVLFRDRSPREIITELMTRKARRE